MSDYTPQDSPKTESPRLSPAMGFILPLVGFLLFGLFSVYLLHQSDAIPSVDQKRAIERVKILKALKEDEESKLGGGYAWVDSSKKIVRIPIDRAMDVVLVELQNKPVVAAYPVGGAPGGTPPAAAPAAAGIPQPPKAK